MLPKEIVKKIGEEFLLSNESHRQNLTKFALVCNDFHKASQAINQEHPLLTLIIAANSSSIKINIYPIGYSIFNNKAIHFAKLLVDKYADRASCSNHGISTPGTISLTFDIDYFTAKRVENNLSELAKNLHTSGLISTKNYNSAVNVLSKEQSRSYCKML